MTYRMRIALTIYYTAFHPAYFTRFCEKGPGNGRQSRMVRAFREFRSGRKKRTTSGGCPQFPKRLSGKLPFHLTSNRNFRMFWLNGKHPRRLKMGATLIFCALPPCIRNPRLQCARQSKPCYPVNHLPFHRKQCISVVRKWHP